MKEFYGDTLRWFIGVVESNADPLHVGRCRVRIYGVHNDDVDAVPESALPWASCVVPTTEDGVSGLGRSPGLKPGAMVFGFFTAGCLVLLESTTQVCVYHGFRGTHESSSGGKKHADDSVAAACRSKSWVIIVQSVVLGVFSTAVSIWIIA